MKKALILGILGLAAAATQSFGQGSTAFDNYDSSPYMPVMYGGKGVTNTTIKVDLLFAIGTQSTTAGMTDAGLAVAIDPGKTALGNAGYWDGVVVTVPGYVSGPVSMAVEAWNTAANNGAGAGYATFAAASSQTTAPGGQWGVSPVWQESSIAGNGLPANFWSGLPGPNGAALLTMTVNPVPEPSIIALCGIGAAALMVSRRKKA